MKDKSKFRVQPESETVEWKQSLGEWKEIVETCAAFATTKGGKVFIGIDPNGTACGVQIGKGTLEDLANKIVQNTSPRQTADISTSLIDRRTVIIVSVAESKIKPVYAFNHAFRRSGRTNQRLAHEDAFQMYADSRGITWDTTVLKETSIRDVDRQAVRRFLQTAREERRWDVSSSTSASKVLNQLGLLNGGKLNIAG